MNLNRTMGGYLAEKLIRKFMRSFFALMQRNNGLLLVLTIGVLLVSSSCAAIQSKDKASAKAQADVTTYSASPGSNVNNEGLDKYKGMPVSITKEGYPRIGSADAPVTIEEYSDFLCPFCARHFNQTLPDLLNNYVATGKVNYVFRDLPLAALHPTSHFGHTAARCVAEQGAALFWKMHDTLFQDQDNWRNFADPSDYLAKAARQSGADMNKYAECISAGQSDAQVQQSISVGEALGFNGTPTFRFIENKTGKVYTLTGAYPVETFHQWADQILAGKAPTQDQPEQSPTTKPAELPLWANAKGLAPDPNRPGFTLAGDPYKGNPQAQVTVVEFADFQCPACQKHALEVQPDIDKALVDTGKIRWVFKNLPLKEHPQSPAAAAAAECAGEQGKFWEMHDRLYANIERWAVDNPDPAILQLAGEQKLDLAKFTTCFNGRTVMEQVLKDVQDSQGVVSTTPTFVILAGGKGTLMNGSRPADQFIAIVQKIIDTASTDK